MVRAQFLSWLVVSLLAAALVGAGFSWLIPVAGRQDIDFRDLPPGWTPSAWPMINDQFGAGSAFACEEAFCGAATKVTVRAKIGYCNCTTGVADDEELERVGDIEALAGDAQPVASGQAITIGQMQGRIRAYARPGQPARAIWSIAVSDQCDVIVATATGDDGRGGDGDGTPALDARALTFLRSASVTRWADRVVTRRR